MLDRAGKIHLANQHRLFVLIILPHFLDEYGQAQLLGILLDLSLMIGDPVVLIAV